MKHFSMFMVLAFLSSAVSPVSEPLEPGADNIVIDFEMVEAGVEWLELVKSGAGETAVKKAFMEKVVPTAGCQAIIMHWARFMDWDAEKLYGFIMEALDPEPDQEKLRNKDGSPSFFAMRRSLWLSALENIPGMRRDLEALKKTDLSQSVGIARSFLPAEAVLDVRFSFVLFGHSSAFSVRKENGFDFLQLPRLADGTLDLAQIVLTFAHELHHSGFKNPEMAEPQCLQLLGLLAAEGMPSYFIDKIGGRLPEYKKSPDKLTQMVAADWEKHSVNLPELYARAANDLAAGLEKKIGPEEIMGFWMDGVKGPAYVLGADMIRVIDKYLGRKEAVSIAADYRNLLRLYNRAAAKANRKGEKCHLFPKELEEKAGNFGK